MTQVTTHQIASASEMRDISVLDNFEEVPRNDPRHRVFDYMKHGASRAYRGGWGPEIIRWDGETASEVHCTHSRAREIREWITDQLFGDHNE